MPKNKKSNKKDIEELRMILDNISIDDLNTKDKEYLKSLGERVDESAKREIKYLKKSFENKKDGEDPLKPTVTIHHRQKEVEKPEFPEVKKEEEKVVSFEDKELYEVEKVETDAPEFIEVVPKETEEKEEVKQETKEIDFIEETEEKEEEFISVEEKETKEPEVAEDLPEWEPVELKEGKIEKVPEPVKEKVEDEEPKVVEEPKEEIEPEFLEEPVKKKQKEELELKEEDISYKLEPFKDLEGIDEKTSVLLYDNGFTTKDALVIASVKDIAKVKGIKKKTAKNIKKELEKERAEELFSEFKEESSQDEKIEDNVEQEDLDKFVEVQEEKEQVVEEPEKVKEEIIEKPEILPEETVKEEVEEDISYELESFKDIENIDDKTAVLLYDNNYLSCDDILFASVKDLVKIGIKKNLAKRIKAEIQDKEDHIGLEPGVEQEAKEGEKDLPIEEFEEKEPEIDDLTKIKAFDDMESIDDKTAVLLYNNHITSIEELKMISSRDLTKIKGIKKKLTKTILDEIDKKEEEALKVKPIELGKSAEGKVTKEQIKDEDKISGKEKITPSPVELKPKSAEWKSADDESEKDADEGSEWESVKDEDIVDIKEEIKEGKDFGEEVFPEEALEDDIINLDEKREEKIDTFKDIKSIDEDTAVLLYNSGITSIRSLQNLSVKDLAKKGITKKIAKKIKKEIDGKIEWGPLVEENGLGDILNGNSEVEEYFSEEFDVDDESTNLDEKILEHEPEIEEEFFEEGKLPPDDRIATFKEIKSIDDNIAKLFFSNGITSVGELANKTIRDLTKIKGIRRKIAKEIKKEVNELLEKTDVSSARTALDLDVDNKSYKRGENPFVDGDKEEDKWETIDEDEEEKSKQKMKRPKGYSYRNYELYEKKIEIKGGKERTVRFFSKEKPDVGEPIKLPKGYEVNTNKKTGVPYLRKKK